MNRLMRFMLCVLTASLGMQGCTTPAKNVPASYVLPAQYEGYTCRQLAVEFQSTQTRIGEIGAKLNEQASKDQLVSVVGAVVFFPALFFMEKASQLETDYAKLLGEAEAMRQSAFQKKCTGKEASSPSLAPP